jgi:HSP20 family protein
MNTAVTQHDSKLRRDNGAGEESYLSPEVNIFETKDGYVLEAEMPGVSKENLELTLENNLLSIVGRRNQDTAGADFVYRESRPAHFRRVFELDPVIDVTRITARVNQGILTLDLPKTEQVKPRKIAVNN